MPHPLASYVAVFSPLPFLLYVVRLYQSDAFQDDLFPPCFSGQPSHSAEEWQQGSEKEPMKMDMRPRSLGVPTDPKAAAALAAKKKKAFAPLKSSKDLQKDVRVVCSGV